MATVICYIHNAWKVDGECPRTEDHIRLQEEYDNRPHLISFASMPGGTTPGAIALDNQNKFEGDMESYREARRAGETPDQVSKEAVFNEQMRVEALETIVEKGELMDVDEHG